MWISREAGVAVNSHCCIPCCVCVVETWDRIGTVTVGVISRHVHAAGAIGGELREGMGSPRESMVSGPTKQKQRAMAKGTRVSSQCLEQEAGRRARCSCLVDGQAVKGVLGTVVAFSVVGLEYRIGRKVP